MAIINGTINDDTLIGTADNDTINVLDGGAGNDNLNGGLGIDLARYTSATGGITANLAAGTVTGAGIGTDTLTGIEQIRGSSFADIYVASGFKAAASPVPGTSPLF